VNLERGARLGSRSSGRWPDSEVSPDGTKFLAITPGPANQQPLTAVIHFLEDVGKNLGLTGKARA
jgi:hypothetical protein